MEHIRGDTQLGDFVETLLAAGFSMGGGSGDGIYSVVPWSWNEPPPYKTPVRWHTGDAKPCIQDCFCRASQSSA